MTATEFYASFMAAETQAQREVLQNEYANQLLSASSTMQTQIITEIGDVVSGIKNQLTEANAYKDCVVTVKGYCDARQVTRQYVYQEIKKGKFKTIELPIFTEYNGKKVAVGTKKFLAF